MHRRELLTGLTASLALASGVAAGGTGETVDGEGVYFRRGKKVVNLHKLSVTFRKNGAVELRLNDEETISGRYTGEGNVRTLELDPTAGTSSFRPFAQIQLEGGSVRSVTSLSAEDPDFMLVFVSDQTLGDAEVDDNRSRGTLKRPGGREVPVTQGRVLLFRGESSQVLIRVATGDGDEKWNFNGTWRRAGGEYSLKITAFWRSPIGELKGVTPAAQGSLEVGGGRRVKKLDLTVPTDRGNVKVTLRRDN